MNYEIFGGFEIPRKPNKKSVVDARDLSTFWKDKVDAAHPNLSSAFGCYVFALRKRGGGVIPWYVGKTSTQGFNKECFTYHKRVYYNEVIADGHGIPLMYLVARTTRSGKLSASAPAREAKFLESTLIGMALNRNQDLKNVTHATFLKQLHVPGLINPKKGAQPRHVREFTSMLNA